MGPRLGFGLPIIRSGDRVLCPKCGRRLYIVTKDIRYGDIIKAEYFAEIEEVPKTKPLTPALSICCAKPWIWNGAVHTDRGWLPHKPEDLTPANKPTKKP